MVFRRFKYLSVFYITLIVLFFGAAVYVLFNTYFWLTSIWLLIFGIALIVYFLNFISKEQRKLSQFILSVNQNDFSPPHSKNYEDLDLNKAFEQLTAVVKSLRDEAQINYQYLQTIVNQINTAIICVNSSNRIVLTNESLRNIFEKKVLNNLNSLEIKNTNLPDILRNLKLGEKKLIKIRKNDKLLHYSIQLAEFKLTSEKFKLFTFQDVQSELEQNEIESWQKLTRVMSHEIMNSAIPISNLSGVVYKRLFDDSDNIATQFDKEEEDDIKEGLQTIESRSKGLVNFIQATRNFTKMPTPRLEHVNVGQLIKKSESLLKSKLQDNNIITEVSLEDNLNILADKALIEQVLINLMLNAIDVLKDCNDAKISIHAFKNSDNRVMISVEDNGAGIEEKDIENIFIPFYTTKKKGSGIGLSLARQIMFLHKGNITVQSKVGFGTKFVISF